MTVEFGSLSVRRTEGSEHSARGNTDWCFTINLRSNPMAIVVSGLLLEMNEPLG